MKITPLEIKQKAFEKKLRGYDKDEVNAFLLTMAGEWERLLDTTKELKINFENSQNEVKKLREVESSLFKTLKTAEDTGANMIDQATKTAELHLRETQMNADAILNEAKTKARSIIDEAEVKARKTMDLMEDELRNLTQLFKKLESLKDGLVSELKHLSSDTLERVDKMTEKIKKFDAESILVHSNRLTSQNTDSKSPQVKQTTTIEDNAQDESPQPKPASQPSLKSQEESSFFDEMD